MSSHNRFSCLKPTGSTDSSGNKYNPPGSRNKFKRPQKTNTRWKRSKSPEKNSRFPKPESGNSFTKPKRDNNMRDNRPRYNKGGFGKFRYNHGRRGPSIFDNVEKDSHGRPMLPGATTGGFNINAALKNSKPKQKREKKKKREIKEDPKLVPFKKEDTKTEEELKAEAEWNKQMILNMQYEWETESEEDEEDGHDPMTPNTNLV